jgi:AAA lid domain-containing protein
MTRAGWDAFQAGQAETAMGRTVMLIGPDGTSWLLVPGQPVQWTANGRSARGLLEGTIAAQSLRLAGPDVDLESVGDAELTLLTAADLPARG